MSTYGIKDGFVKMTLDQVRQYETVIRARSTHTELEIFQLLDKVFASGLPINGVGARPMIDMPRAIMDWAADEKYEAVLLYMLDKAPDLTYHPDGLLGNCLWSPRAVKKLLAIGKDVQTARVVWPSFDANLKFVGAPEVMAPLAQHGYNLNETVTIGKETKPFLIHLGTRPEKAAAALYAGVDPTVRGKAGRSVLHIAVDGDLRGTVPNYDSDDAPGGKTMILTQFSKLAKAFADLGIDVNMPDDAGATPLHLAARRGYGNKVRLLLEAGADPSLLDAKGKTPAALAKAGKHGDVMSILAAAIAKDAIMKTVHSLPSLAISKP